LIDLSKKNKHRKHLLSILSVEMLWKPVCNWPCIQLQDGQSWYIVWEVNSTTTKLRWYTHRWVGEYKWRQRTADILSIFYFTT